MACDSKLVLATLVGSLVAAPAAVTAQTAAPWSGLRPSALQTVHVQDRSGQETTGRLLALTPDALVLLIDDAERRFDRGDVARIQTRDSLKNGVVIGASLGVAMGLLGGGMADCPTAGRSGPCLGFRAVIVGISTLTYASIGVGVDALIRGRQTLYAESGDTRSRLTLGGSPNRPTVQLALSW